MLVVIRKKTKRHYTKEIDDKKKGPVGIWRTSKKLLSAGMNVQWLCSLGMNAYRIWRVAAERPNV